MKNNDIVNLEEMYYKVISRGNNERLLKEDDETDAAMDSKYGFSDSQESTSEEPMPNLKNLAAVRNLKPMLTHMAMVDLNKAWDENYNEEPDKNKRTMLFFGEPSTGKTEGIYNFCNEKAAELGLDARGRELNKMIKNSVEYKKWKESDEYQKRFKDTSDEKGAKSFIDYAKLPPEFKKNASFIENEIRSGNVFTLFQVNGDQIIPMEIMGIPDLLNRPEPTGDEKADKLAVDTYNIKEAPMTLAMEGNAKGIFFIDEFNRTQKLISDFDKELKKGNIL
jgi:hypothetical protein